MGASEICESCGKDIGIGDCPQCEIQLEALFEERHPFPWEDGEGEADGPLGGPYFAWHNVVDANGNEVFRSRHPLAHYHILKRMNAPADSYEAGFQKGMDAAREVEKTLEVLMREIALQVHWDPDFNKFVAQRFRCRDQDDCSSAGDTPLQAVRNFVSNMEAQA